VLHLPNVLRFLRHRVVLPGKPQRLPETGVLLLRHQETQTQIGEPDGDSFPHGLDALRHRRGDKLDGIGFGDTHFCQKSCIAGGQITEAMPAMKARRSSFTSPPARSGRHIERHRPRRWSERQGSGPCIADIRSDRR